MTWVYGIDCSFDELTAAEAQRLKAAGVQVFEQCLWTGKEQPAPRVINLRVAQQAGMTLVGYISITPQTPGGWHVNQARTGVPDDIWAALTKTPIDVELDGLTLTNVLEALDQAAKVGGSRDIYTNFDTWVNKLGNPTRPPGVGLQNALWDNAPDFDFTMLRFGGWQDEEVWGEQWSGGTYVEGQFADRDQFRAEALQLRIPPNTPTPQPPSTAKDLNRARIADLLAQLSAEVAP